MTNKDNQRQTTLADRVKFSTRHKHDTVKWTILFILLHVTFSWLQFPLLVLLGKVWLLLFFEYVYPKVLLTNIRFRRAKISTFCQYGQTMVGLWFDLWPLKQRRRFELGLSVCEITHEKFTMSFSVKDNVMSSSQSAMRPCENYSPRPHNLRRGFYLCPVVEWWFEMSHHQRAGDVTRIETMIL